jgi:PIN domain nuclease of toxin-antitoxin system
MTYLLDTHTLIWAITDPSQLSAKARQIIEDPAQEVVVSAITFWEISLKYALGKLELENIAPQDFPNLCKQMDIKVLDLDAASCATYHLLTAQYHKDPFDRMLIRQAISLGIPILSKDKLIKLYEPERVVVIW